MVWLFLAVCLAYLLTAGSNFSSGDTFAELRVSQSLVERGAFDVPIMKPGQICAGWGCRGVDGHYYASHGIGFSLFLAPFYVGAATVVKVFSPPRCDTWDTCVPIHLISWSNCALSALIVVVLCALCLDLGYSMRRALLASLVYGFATLAWPYARFGFDVTPTALLLLASFREALLAGRSADRAGRRRWLRSGFLAGAAILVRLPTIPALAPLAAWALLAPASDARQRARRLAGFLLPVLCVLAFSAWYNLDRFGSVFNDGHTANAADQFVFQPWVGLTGMTISAGKGLLWYCPVVVFALIGLPRFLSRHEIPCKVGLSMAALSLLPYLFVPDWYGGSAWGPRFVLPVLPLLLLPALDAPEEMAARMWTRLLAVAILAYSVIIQLAGQLVSYPLRLRRADMLHISEHALLWDPRHSPILDQLGTLFTYITHPSAATVPVPLAESFDIWWLNLWRSDSLPREPVLLAAGIV
ncbi:MAG: hypothetical protein ACRDIE_19630, partial [Chloroflexota bacterium]